jgi:hypothetical protein
MSLNISLNNLNVAFEQLQKQAVKPPPPKKILLPAITELLESNIQNNPSRRRKIAGSYEIILLALVQHF